MKSPHSFPGRGLLVAATPIEISPFLQEWKAGHLPGLPELDVLITGIGLTATTYALTTQFQTRRPAWVIQAGVGGCFDTRLPLGSVVLVKQEAIADQSVVELNRLKTLFDLDLVPANRPPYTKGWLVNKTPVPSSVRLKKVKGISVNEITTSPARVRFYRDYFNPVIESMEGAALHYVCLLEQIPFWQLRSVSNYIGERNKKKWDMSASLANLNRELIRFLQS